MNQKLCPVISILLVLFWMVFIFIFSAQPAERSSQNSDGIVNQIIENGYPEFSDQNPEEQASIRNTITVIVRKSAHLGEYALLSILIYAFCTSFKSDFVSRHKWWIAFAISVVYAASDEIHQLFVPGRSGEVRDVLIDSLGAAIGIVIISYLHRTIAFKKENSSEE